MFCCYVQAQMIANLTSLIYIAGSADDCRQHWPGHGGEPELRVQE